jgi:predicted nucleic acid-binding Zn ribbon protein
MFCSKCGKENPDDAGFCSTCGSALNSIPEKAVSKPWSDSAMNVLLFGTGLLPIIGIVAGLIGICKPAARAQGIALLGFGIGTAIMFGVATPVGGLIFGLGMASLLVFMPKKKCPDCGTDLPKFRLPQKNQALRGGWICPNCNCQVDRKGNRVKSGGNEIAKETPLPNPADTLRRKRRARAFWGWFLLTTGFGLTVLMVLVYFFPGKDDNGEISRLSMESLLITSGFFVLCFMMPGLFLLTRAKKLQKEIQAGSGLSG